MNLTEMRTNFGSWAVMSAPLILAMDLRDKAMLDAVWPVVSNREVIAINQQWAGDAGRVHAASQETALLPNCGSGNSCHHPSWLVLTKALPNASSGSRAAIMLLNNADRRATVSANLSGIVGLGSCAQGCSVRDLWARADLGSNHSLSVTLDPHDSFLAIVASPAIAPPMPPPSPGPTPPGPAPPLPPPGQVAQGILFASDKPGNELINSRWVNVTADTQACLALCEHTTRCVGVSYRISLKHCWLHASCKYPSRDRNFNSALVAPTSADHAHPPSLPSSFRADIVRHVTEPRPSRRVYAPGAVLPSVLTNLSVAYDGERLRYHIRDFSFGSYYEAWGLFDRPSPVIYTYSPENIPGPTHCVCLPSSNLSYLPEFYSLARATPARSNASIDGQRVDEWTVRGEILSNDTYTAWVRADGGDSGELAVPVRTLWIDPGPGGESTRERSDYSNVVVGTPPEWEFVPNSNCLNVSC